MKNKYIKNKLKYKIINIDNEEYFSLIGLVNINDLPDQLILSDDISGNITINNKTLKLIEVSNAAFVNCNNLKSKLILPNSIKYIRENAFACCSNLHGNLVIPNNTKVIESGAFYQCYGFNGNLIIPDSVEELGIETFYECFNFDSLKLSNSLKNIPYGCFNRNTGFKNELVLPNKLISIHSYSFEGCSNINKIIWNKNLETIEDYAFYNCDKLSLESKQIPKSIKNIGKYIF